MMGNTRRWVWAATAVGLLTLVSNAEAAGPTAFTTASRTPAVSALSTYAGVGMAVNARTASSASGSTAVNGVASSPGEGVTVGVRGHSLATAGRGVYGLASAATGPNVGVWGQSSSPDGRGVYGVATRTAGRTFGVLGESAPTNFNGVGVGGTGGTGVEAVGVGAHSTGVLAYSGSRTPGDGTLGIHSETDARLDGHLLVDNKSTQRVGPADIAGLCQVPAQIAQATCLFRTPLPEDAVPIVVVTPTTNPGSFYWVTPVIDSSERSTGFIINMAAPSSSPVVFNYVVVGQLSGVRTG